MCQMCEQPIITICFLKKSLFYFKLLVFKKWGVDLKHSSVILFLNVKLCPKTLLLYRLQHKLYHVIARDVKC